MTGALIFVSGCLCAGSGCGGHVMSSSADITPIGWQGVAQHTYTRACAGHHPPGPCPVREEAG
jgi:hypothetical protein